MFANQTTNPTPSLTNYKPLSRYCSKPVYLVKASFLGKVLRLCDIVIYNLTVSVRAIVRLKPIPVTDDRFLNSFEQDRPRGATLSSPDH